MEIVVGSKHLLTRIFSALDVSGREHLVIMAKASWQIPAPGQRPRPLPPTPFADADIYLAEPGESPMLYGADAVRFKPRCDVLFDAVAHAPGGKPAREFMAGFRVGEMQKLLQVHGPRRWAKRLGITTLGDPEAVAEVALHHGLAFGGARQYAARQAGQAVMLTEALLSNPTGLGWVGKHSQEQVNDLPAPQLAYPDDPIRHPDGAHRPAALSAIGRHWQPRSQYAGTYDQVWQREVFPFLPEDYDEQFHQCAPIDQQMPYPQGGEAVVLLNLIKDRPEVRFALPPLNAVPVQVLRNDYDVEEPACVADTLFFETQASRFSVVWRASVPIRRRIQEFHTITIGPVNEQWWAKRQVGIDESCAGCGQDEEDA